MADNGAPDNDLRSRLTGPEIAPKSWVGTHLATWNRALAEADNDPTKLKDQKPELFEEHTRVWTELKPVVGMSRYFVEKQLQQVPGGPEGVAVLGAKLEGMEQTMAGFWADSTIAGVLRGKSDDKDEFARYLVGGGIAREWASRMVDEGYLTDEDATAYGKALKVHASFPEPRPLEETSAIIRITEGQTTGEAGKPSRSFEQLQKELADMLRAGREDSEAERALKEDRQYWVKAAKEAGILKGIQEAVDAPLQTGLPFESAYEKVKQMELRLNVFEKEASELPGYKPEMDGMVRHFWANARINYERALAAAEGDTVREGKSERYLDLMSWGTVPRGKVDAAATKYVTEQKQNEQKKAAERLEEQRRQQEAERQRAEAAAREQARQEQEARLQERQEKTAEELGRVADALRDGGSRQSEITVEAAKVNPDKVLAGLVNVLLIGKWDPPEMAGEVRSAISKLRGETDPKVNLLRALDKLIDDLGQGERNKPETHTKISLGREDLVELLKQPGATVAWRDLMLFAGFDLQAVGKDVWKTGAQDTLVDRSAVLTDLVPQNISRVPQFQHLFIDEDGAPRRFWDLKARDFSDSQDQWGYITLLKMVAAEKMNKDISSPEVQTAVAIGVGVLKQSRLLEQFATEPDHPWIDGEIYRLMHPAEAFRRRARSDHDAAKNARLAPYVKKFLADFGERDPSTGLYSDEPGMPGRAAFLVPGTNFTWNELYFPPDILKSWVFAPDVMARGGALWDHMVRGQAPSLEDFKPKSIFELESKRRGAAVALDKMLYDKNEPLSTDTRAKGAYADAIATDVATIVKDLGWVNKAMALNVHQGDESGLERIKPDVMRMLRMVIVDRLGMTSARGVVNAAEDKALALSYALQGLEFKYVFTQDDGLETPVTLPLEDTRFLDWLSHSGVPYPDTNQYLPEHMVIKWLRRDELAQSILRKMAQGAGDAESLRDMDRFNNRRKMWGKTYGGLGAKDRLTFVSERINLATKDPIGMKRVAKKMTALNFG